jgi:hypothetical protein
MVWNNKCEGSVLSNHKVPNYLVERVLLGHTGNLQWTDNLDERVAATVTSDLAHPREGDNATYHPIEHNPIIAPVVAIETLTARVAKGCQVGNLVTASVIGVIFRPKKQAQRSWVCKGRSLSRVVHSPCKHH